MAHVRTQTHAPARTTACSALMVPVQAVRPVRFRGRGGLLPLLGQRRSARLPTQDAVPPAGHAAILRGACVQRRATQQWAPRQRHSEALLPQLDVPQC